MGANQTSMQSNKTSFLELIIQQKILRFGEFTLKSGRVSPYFFNAGLFSTGELLADLAAEFADLIQAKLPEDFVLYGPAYKGIPLAAATAVQLSARYQRSVPYAYNRKEAKDHGEGGVIVGAELQGDVVIIDDVITAGTSIKESVDLIRAAGATPKAVVIAVDRQERAGDAAYSAVQDVEQRYGMPVYSIVNLDAIVAYAQVAGTALIPNVDAVLAYRDRYGVAEKLQR